MYEISKAHDVSILHLFGEVSLLEMELIQKLLSSFKRADHTKIILDLARVDYVHFEAVRRWAAEAMTLRQKNGDLRLVSPNRDTKMVLRFTGADQLIKDYASLSEGILSFLKSVSFTPPSRGVYSSEGAVMGEKNKMEAAIDHCKEPGDIFH